MRLCVTVYIFKILIYLYFRKIHLTFKMYLMKKMFFSFLMLVCAAVNAQKNISCKKGNIKADEVLVGEYDGKGGIFKMFKLGVFAPGSKDTLISITEIAHDPMNPMFDAATVYKLDLTNSAKKVFYIKTPVLSRYMERDIMQLVFHDSLPLFLENGKINAEMLEKYRAKMEFGYEKVVGFIKEVEDSLKVFTDVPIKRDMSKPASLVKVNDKSLSIPGYAQYSDVNETYEIKQGDVLIGRLQKKVSGGSMSKASYTFWKYIGPQEVKGIALKYAPVAITTISAGEAFNVDVTLVIGKQTFKYKPGAYNQQEYVLLNSLIAQGIF